MSSRRGLIPDLPRSAWIVLAGDTFSAIGGGLVLPFLIVYLHRVREIDLEVAGLAVATVALVGFIASPLAGVLIDRIGARDALILGLIVSASGSVLIANVHSVWQAFLACGVHGIGVATFWPSIHSLLTGLVTAKQRPSVFSVHYMMLNFGLGLGGITGGLIADISSPRSFEILYLIDAATFLVFVAILMSLTGRLPAGVEAVASGEAEPARYVVVMRDRLFRRVWALMVLLVVVGYSQLESGFPAYATGKGSITTEGLGLAFGANTFVIVFAQLVVLRRVEGWKRTQAIRVLCACWTASWVVTIAAGQFGGGVAGAIGFAMAMALFALGETLLSPSVPAIVNDLATDALRGRYNAVYTLAWSVGQIVGPAFAGFVLGAGLNELLFVFLIAGTLLAGQFARSLERLLPAEANRIGDETPELEPV